VVRLKFNINTTAMASTEKAFIVED
jgi:hypothetical protein